MHSSVHDTTKTHPIHGQTPQDTSHHNGKNENGKASGPTRNIPKDPTTSGSNHRGTPATTWPTAPTKEWKIIGYNDSKSDTTTPRDWNSSRYICPASQNKKRSECTEHWHIHDITQKHIGSQTKQGCAKCLHHTIREAIIDMDENRKIIKVYIADTVKAGIQNIKERHKEIQDFIKEEIRKAQDTIQEAVWNRMERIQNNTTKEEGMHTKSVK
jgi:hypothetical protein